MPNVQSSSKRFSREMQLKRTKLVILGLSITSSWGNGHATTYRALVHELVRRDYHVTFLERDVPWYAGNRDAAEGIYGQVQLYSSLDELKTLYTDLIREADCVIVGSYVPQGIEIGEWVTETAEGLRVFYDIDTPITQATLEQGTC